MFIDIKNSYKLSFIFFFVATILDTQEFWVIIPYWIPWWGNHYSDEIKRMHGALAISLLNHA